MFIARWNVLGVFKAEWPLNKSEDSGVRGPTSFVAMFIGVHNLPVSSIIV